MASTIRARVEIGWRSRHFDPYACVVPILPLVAAVAVVVLVVILLTPLMLVQRYRMGAARRLGRRWVALMNVALLALSVGVFVLAAAITSFWIPDALTYTAMGLAVGALLGVVGLVLSRWESTPHSLHYTPNRWLVLAITLVVAARIAYGCWRAFHARSAGVDEPSLLAAAGVAGSMGAGAVVLGYHLTYWLGLWERLRRHRRHTARHRHTR